MVDHALYLIGSITGKVRGLGDWQILVCDSGMHQNRMDMVTLLAREYEFAIFDLKVEEGLRKALFSMGSVKLLRISWPFQAHDLQLFST